MGATNMGTTTRTADNDGFNPGWLGLLGLAGTGWLAAEESSACQHGDHPPPDRYYDSLSVRTDSF